MNITENYYYHLKKMKNNLIIKSNIDSGDIATGEIATGVLQYAPNDTPQTTPQSYSPQTIRANRHSPRPNAQSILSN